MVAGGIDITGFNVDIGKVPFPCGLIANFRGLTIGFAVFVGPSRAADEIRRREVVLVSGKQRVDSLLNERRKARVGDHAYDLVALVAPSKEPVRWA